MMKRRSTLSPHPAWLAAVLLLLSVSRAGRAQFNVTALAGLELSTTLAASDGAPIVGSVLLTDPAPTELAVSLKSDNPAVIALPASVKVGAGTNRATFTLTTQPVSKSTPVVITATLGAVSRRANLSLTATKTVAHLSVARIAVFRPSTGHWVLRNVDGVSWEITLGMKDDQLVPADYVADDTETSRAQVAIFRPGTQEWVIRKEDSIPVTIQFGIPGDLPVPADYLGAGRAQIAVFRPTTAQWIIRTAQDPKGSLDPRKRDTEQYFFGAPSDTPVPADYLGLGKAQAAVYRPSTGEWFIRQPDDGQALRVPFGQLGDQPVPGNYVGVEIPRDQVAVFRPSTQQWLVGDLQGNTIKTIQIKFVQVSVPSDVLVPRAYDATDHVQPAVFRPSTAEWFIGHDNGSTETIVWGRAGDAPAAAAHSFRFGK